MKPARFSDMKRVRKMELNEFNRWVTSIYKSGFDDGLDVGALWSDEDIYELLRSEHIGVERAARIVERLLRGKDGI